MEEVSLYFPGEIVQGECSISVDKVSSSQDGLDSDSSLCVCQQVNSLFIHPRVLLKRMKCAICLLWGGAGDGKCMCPSISNVNVCVIVCLCVCA